MTIGVYEFENQITKYKYIGSSFNIENRYKEHLKRLRNNKHHNKYFQNSYNIHGLNSFTFKIIIICENNINDVLLRQQEQIYIDTYDFKKLYNQCPVAGSTKGKKHSFETKRKISKSNTGKKMSDESCAKMSATRTGKKFSIEHRVNLSKAKKGKPNIHNRKVVVQIDLLSSKELNIFDSIAIATNTTGVDSSSIIKVCNNKRTQAGGFVWKFKYDENKC